MERALWDDRHRRLKRSPGRFTCPLQAFTKNYPDRLATASFSPKGKSLAGEGATWIDLTISAKPTRAFRTARRAGLLAQSDATLRLSIRARYVANVSNW